MGSGIRLAWQAPADAGGAAVTGYRIYRGTSSGGEALVGTVGATTTAVIDAYPSTLPGTIYYYKVTALNSAGESPRSNEASAGAA